MAEREYLIEQEYFNLDKSESIIIKIPKDTVDTDKLTKIGIWCSGGADSSALLYLLAKTIKDHKLDIAIQPMTVRRQRPWNPVKAAAVIHRVSDLLDFNQMLPHQVYFPNRADANQTEWQEFQDTDKENGENGTWDTLFDGLTSNPPEGVMPYSNHEEHRRGPDAEKVLASPSGLHFRPFWQIDKRFIADIYREHNLINSLFPITWSCEGTVEDSCNFTIHCEKCWWCIERIWAFGRL